MKFFSCKLYVTTLQHCKILPAFCNLIRWQQVTFLSILFFARVKCRARVPFVTQESLFVNENLIL